MTFLKWLAYPLTKDLDLDDPRLTETRVEVIQRKPFLHQIYQEWYAKILSVLPSIDGAVLELGSGAGFLNEVIPGLITSDVFRCSSVQILSDARALPFPDSALRAIVMTNVFHHIPDVHQFLAEAERCIKPGGAIIMIEPWVTPWSRLIYGRMHHEPLVTDTSEWGFPSDGPLSSANTALPWIVFRRDISRLQYDHPGLRIQRIDYLMPIRYILSGGLAWRSFAPGWSFHFWKQTESLFGKWMDKMALFALVKIERMP